MKPRRPALTLARPYVQPRATAATRRETRSGGRSPRYLLAGGYPKSGTSWVSKMVARSVALAIIKPFMSGPLAFDGEAREVFDQLAGDVLIALGYAYDDTWVGGGDGVATLG